MIPSAATSGPGTSVSRAPIPEQLRRPLGLVARGLRKLVVDPFRYRGPGGYDAERYWGDRFSHYRFSLRGSGHEGLSEEENEAAYARARRVLGSAFDALGIDLSTVDVLEVGPGSGAFTRFLADRGVTSYLGVDVTDVLFADLSAQHPEYTFQRLDVTETPIPGTYDLVLLIEVIQHIVDDERLTGAFGHILTALRPDGTLLVGPVSDDPKPARKRLFNVRLWTVAEVTARCPGREVRDLGEFRGGRLLAVGRRTVTDEPPPSPSPDAAR